MSKQLLAAEPKRERRTAAWVAFIACTTLIFDGYDLTIYGTVMPTLLNDPTHIGELDAGTAGALGSYAMLGVLVGAILCGSFGDFVGRRKVIIFSLVWFSGGMIFTALSASVATFGAFRFLIGLGLGAILAAAGATMAEFAPEGKRNLYNAIVYCGIPAGGVLAALLGILLLEPLGWRGLFFIGALPIILVPIAWFKLPESPQWLLTRGHRERAFAVAKVTGNPLYETPARAANLPGASVEKAAQRTGFAALVTKKYFVATIVLGLVSFAGLLLTYGLNTWLPRIMEGYGYDVSGSLTFLLILNGGAVIGALLGSRLADKYSPRPIIITTFTLAAVSLVMMTFALHIGLLLAFIAFAGVGTLGTQVLGYGYVSNYFNTQARSAGVAWFAGFGRLGGVAGPFVGGLLATWGFGGAAAFYVFAGVALFGAIMVVLVPRQPEELDPETNSSEVEIVIAESDAEEVEAR